MLTELLLGCIQSPVRPIKWWRWYGVAELNREDRAKEVRAGTEPRRPTQLWTLPPWETLYS